MKPTPNMIDKSAVSGRVPEQTEDAFADALEATNIQKITIET